MDRRTRLTDLSRVPSPFRHCAAPPWWARLPGDVPELNAAAAGALRELIAQVQPEGSTPQAALVLGAPGSGKTHLLGQLAGSGRAPAAATVLTIPPPVDGTRPLRHLAALLASTLAYRRAGDREPAGLARILAKAVASWLADDEGRKTRRAVRKKQMSITREWSDISALVSEWTQDRHPELWPPLLEVLMQYPVPARQARAVQWIRGDSLSDNELAELALTPEQGKTSTDLENQAGWKVASLTRLLALDRPLVVAFDNLESDAWHERRAALNRMLELLLTSAHHVLVVATARTDGWGRVAEGLESSLRDRFARRFEMGGCSRGQVDALIARRLEAVPKSPGAPDGTDLFPFDDPLSRHQLMDLAAGGRPLARDVLRKGRQMWTREVSGDGASETAEAYLAGWLDDRIHVLEDELERYPPEEGVLLEALVGALEYKAKDAPVAAEAMVRPTAKGQEGLLNARLRTRAGTFRFRFIASTRREPVALAEPVWLALRQIGAGELDIPVVVRDFRSPVPDFKGFPGKSPLDALLDAGGYVMEMDRKSMARCWAIRELRACVAAQQLEVISADGELTAITKAQLTAFLAERPLWKPVLAGLSVCASRLRDLRAKRNPGA